MYTSNRIAFENVEFVFTKAHGERRKQTEHTFAEVYPNAGTRLASALQENGAFYVTLNEGL